QFVLVFLVGVRLCAGVLGVGGHHIEPRINKLKPILDNTVTRRRAVLEKSPVAIVLAVAPDRRIPAKLLLAGREDNEHTILPSFELLVIAHTEGSDHKTLYHFHDIIGCQADLIGKTFTSSHAPTKIVKIHVATVT